MSERLVLTALLQLEEYAKKIVGYIEPEYFELEESRRIFHAVRDYVVKYRAIPSRLAMETLIGNDPELDEAHTVTAEEMLGELYATEAPDNVDWVIDTTEKWCKDRALYLAINKSITIYQGEDKKLEVTAIPELVRAALATSFDRSLGMDYFTGAEKRWEYYTTPENKIPFRIAELNDITAGGVTRKSLNVIAAGVNVGKTLCMCSLAADYLRLGYKVLYISMEMREELIAQRIDANLMSVDANKLKDLGKEAFLSRVQALREKSRGELRVKDYPPSGASSIHFEALLDEYELMDGFTPDIIMVDYIQIVASSRMKSDSGSYYYYKSVAEELRSIGVKRDKVVWTVAQFNRGGMDNSDPSMTDTGESVGIPATADGMWAVMRTEELDQIGQLSWKQLKSRYANKAVKPTFLTGVDVEKFTIYGIANTSDNVVRARVQDSQAPVSSGAVKSRFSKLKFGKESK